MHMLECFAFGPRDVTRMACAASFTAVSKLRRSTPRASLWMLIFWFENSATKYAPVAQVR